MQTTVEAEEHLRIIRSLMERATIYRAISAPSALVGGMLAVVAAIVSIVLPGEYISRAGWHLNFAGVWLVVLFLSTAANLHFLRRDANRRNETFMSPGMRLALVSLLPSFVAAGVFTFVMSLLEVDVVLVCFWLIFYGLGLLATTHFAPRSIRYLGWAFLSAGLASLVASFGWSSADHFTSWKAANGLMAATFGGFHLIYAACTWPRRVSSVAAAAAL